MKAKSNRSDDETISTRDDVDDDVNQAELSRLESNVKESLRSIFSTVIDRSRKSLESNEISADFRSTRSKEMIEDRDEESETPRDRLKQRAKIMRSFIDDDVRAGRLRNRHEREELDNFSSSFAIVF